MSLSKRVAAWLGAIALAFVGITAALGWTGWIPLQPATPIDVSWTLDDRCSVKVGGLRPSRHEGHGYVQASQLNCIVNEGENERSLLIRLYQGHETWDLESPPTGRHVVGLLGEAYKQWRPRWSRVSASSRFAPSSPSPAKSRFTRLPQRLQSKVACGRDGFYPRKPFFAAPAVGLGGPYREEGRSRAANAGLT